jgi:hypothetical protein
VATQTARLDSAVPFASTTSIKSRILAIVLMIGIAAFFWVDSRYPALYKNIIRAPL